MLIHLRDLAATPSHRVRFDYTTDLSKEEVGFEYPFRQPVRLACRPMSPPTAPAAASRWNTTRRRRWSFFW